MCFYALERLTFQGSPFSKSLWKSELCSRSPLFPPSPTNSEGQRFAFRASGIEKSHLALQLPCFPSIQKLLIFDSWGNRLICEQEWFFLSGTLIYHLVPKKCILHAVSPAASQASLAACMPCSPAPHFKTTETAGRLPPLIILAGKAARGRCGNA